jgi:drug/metabolite transporter (DMT)-like permease
VRRRGRRVPECSTGPRGLRPPDTLERVSFGLLTGLGAALAWGTMDVGSALAARRVGSLAVTAGGQAVSAVILLALLVASGSSLPSDPRAILVAAAVGVVGAGAYLAYFTGLRVGPIAVVSGMVAAYGGLTVLLAVIVRSETLTPLQALGAVIATIGVVMTGVAFDSDWRHTHFAGPGVVFAIVALVLFAVMTIGAAGPIRAVGWLPVIFVGRLTSAIVSVSLLAIALRLRPTWMAPLMEAPAERTSAALPVAGLAGLLDAAGLVSFSIGLEVSETWLVGLASSFGPAVAVLVAVALLGERLRPTQWLGLAGIGLGLAVVAVG